MRYRGRMCASSACLNSIFHNICAYAHTHQMSTFPKVSLAFQDLVWLASVRLQLTRSSHTHNWYFQASIIALTHPWTRATRELSFVDLLEKPCVTHACHSAPSISSRKRMSVQRKDNLSGTGTVPGREQRSPLAMKKLPWKKDKTDELFNNENNHTPAAMWPHKAGPQITNMWTHSGGAQFRWRILCKCWLHWGENGRNLPRPNFAAAGVALFTDQWNKTDSQLISSSNLVRQDIKEGRSIWVLLKGNMLIWLKMSLKCVCVCCIYSGRIPKGRPCDWPPAQRIC